MRDKKGHFDIIIIGAGVVGCAIARELSKYKLDVAVLEKEDDVGWGTSCRNTGVVHAGFGVPPGSLRAKLCVEGNINFEKLCQTIDVPYKKIGKLTVAKEEKEIEGIKKLEKQGKKNRVKDLVIIGEQELNKMEPNIRGVAALYSPNSAITVPYLLTIALAENAYKNGVQFLLNTEVVNIEKNSYSPDFEIITKKGKFYANYIINSAGLYADQIANMVGIKKYQIYPCRGEYYILDKNASGIVNHLIYPAPQEETGGWGTHISPTIDGNILIGPSAEYIKEKDDFANTKGVMNYLYLDARKFTSLISPKLFIRNYSGIRAKQTPPSVGGYLDFKIEESKQVKNFINLIGIESPALTACVSIAKVVANILLKKEKLERNPKFDPYRKGILRFAEQDEKTKKALIQQNPDYGEIICRCEQVTKKEILDAIYNPFRARSLNSIKYRTRAMMGRCQGGYCLTRIIEILEKELDYTPKDFRLKGNNSYLFSGYRGNEIE